MQDISAFPHTDAVVNEVSRRKPMHRRFLSRSIAALSAQERADAEKCIQFMLSEGNDTNQLASAYLVIVEDTFREEIHFSQTGRYRYTSFAEAKEAVYDNPVYMKNYMIGLALSSFWWTNHVLIRRFFNAHLPELARRGGVYREVGPGHGMFFLEALRSGKFDVYEGVDISATSIEMTRRVVEGGFFGSLPSCRLRHGDFLSNESIEPADLLVMGEVLEHVQDPAAFLARAHQTTSANSRLYLTTCINAPAVDHLYNPGTITALESLFDRHGFHVLERGIFPREGKTVEECEQERLAVNVAYVLGK